MYYFMHYVMFTVMPYCLRIISFLMLIFLQIASILFVVILNACNSLIITDLPLAWPLRNGRVPSFRRFHFIVKVPTVVSCEFTTTRVYYFGGGDLVAKSTYLISSKGSDFIKSRNNLFDGSSAGPPSSSNNDSHSSEGPWSPSFALSGTFFATNITSFSMWNKRKDEHFANVSDVTIVDDDPRKDESALSRRLSAFQTWLDSQLSGRKGLLPLLFPSVLAQLKVLSRAAPFCIDRFTTPPIVRSLYCAMNGYFGSLGQVVPVPAAVSGCCERCASTRARALLLPQFRGGFTGSRIHFHVAGYLSGRRTVG